MLFILLTYFIIIVKRDQRRARKAAEAKAVDSRKNQNPARFKDPNKKDDDYNTVIMDEQYDLENEMNNR